VGRPSIPPRGSPPTARRCTSDPLPTVLSRWRLPPATCAGVMSQGAKAFPFKTGCLPLSYSGNPGVDGVSYRVQTGTPVVATTSTPRHCSLETAASCMSVSERFPCAPLQHRLLTPESQWQSRGKMACLTGVTTGNARGRLRRRRCLRPACCQWAAAVEVHDAFLVRRRFPWTPLQNCLFTPESPWQSRGKRRV
jgi:hypothetical protein